MKMITTERTEDAKSKISYKLCVSLRTLWLNYNYQEIKVLRY